jgi:hypothetical protein
MSDQATIIAIAEALKDFLNSTSFSQSFTAARDYAPAFTLEELATLRVTVVPKSLEPAAVARDRSQLQCQVDVGIQKKIDPARLKEDVDALMAVVEEIALWICGRVLPGFADPKWQAMTNTPIYDPEKLRTEAVFISVITVTYVATKRTR